MNIDLPPYEVIEAIESDLGLQFQHLIISPGESTPFVIEGVFGEGSDAKTVVFEPRRVLPLQDDDDDELFQKECDCWTDGEHEDECLWEDKPANLIEPSDETPQFDEDWYCP